MNINEKVTILSEELKKFQESILIKQSISEQTKYLPEVIEKAKREFEKLENIDKTNEEEIHTAKNYIIDLGRMAERLENLYKTSSYNVEEVQKLNNYLNIYAQYQYLTLKIKTAERLSKKSQNKKVSTQNAEGRKKEIDQDFIEEYNQWVTQKKNLQKEYLHTYNILMDYDIRLLTTPKKEVESVSVENEFSQNLDDIELTLYQKSDEELLKEVENQMKEILNGHSKENKGKKRLLYYQGEKYQISERSYGKFRSLNYQKRNLEKKIAEQKEEPKNTAISTPEESKPSVEKENPIVEIPTNSVSIKSVNSKKRKDMKKRIKRIALAATIAITTVTSIFAQKTINLSRAESAIEHEIDHEDHTSTIDVQEIENDIKPAEIASLNVEDMQMNLQDKFTVLDNTQIYSNEYDMAKGVHGKSMLFDHQKQRECAGIVFKLPNGEVKIAKSDEQIQNYNNIHAELEGYLAQNEHGYEGFFQAEDTIKLEKELGGFNR